MSNFKTYFKKSVSVCKKGFAYVKVSISYPLVLNNLKAKR